MKNEHRDGPSCPCDKCFEEGVNAQINAMLMSPRFQSDLMKMIAMQLQAEGVQLPEGADVFEGEDYEEQDPS